MDPARSLCFAFLPQKILVMPNMDDVWLTVMHSAVDPRSDSAVPESQGTTTVPEADTVPSEGP